MALVKNRNRRLFAESLEDRHLMSGMAFTANSGGLSAALFPIFASAKTPSPPANARSFDDSSLAPAGLQSVTSLPNLPVFNVRNFGATGNGIADDTLAIRHALSAAQAAHGGIIYLPAGTYNVSPQVGDPSAWGAIFTITSSNIVFIGDGANRTHLEGYCQGLKNPVTTWYVTGDSYSKIGRFAMFHVDSSASASAISNVQFRSLDIEGNAGYTGNSQVGGNIATGDGWDLTHKAIEIFGSQQITGVLVFNCNIGNWRGEEIYAGGGTNLGTIDVINCHVFGSNGSAISATGTVLIDHTTIGGSNPGNDVYNGVENLDFAGQNTTVQNSTIMCSSNASNLHGNGVAFIGLVGSSLNVTNTQFVNNWYGILFSETAHNVVVQQSTFSHNVHAMITSILELYPGVVTGFSNFSISGNTFASTGAAFLSQNYSSNSTGIPNLVFSGNYITNGVLLEGGFAGPAAGWSGFRVDGTKLGVGAIDIGTYVGSNVAIWTNTSRIGPPNPYSSGVKVDNFTQTALITIAPLTDLTYLNYHAIIGIQYVTMTAASLKNYPVGFQTTIYATDSTWVLKADKSWNTFPRDQPIGPNGLTIRVNAQGLFEIVA